VYSVRDYFEATETEKEDEMIQAECTNHCGKRTDTRGICRYCMTRIILEGDARDKLKEIESNTIDEMCTDPPYGYSFMNKDWDKAIISVEIWRECLRVLKPGAFAFVMSAPRQDVLSHMIVNLTDAGFVTNFTSIYWAYGTGFPKAMNIHKKTKDKKLDGSYAGFQPKPAVEVVLVCMKPLDEKNYVEQAMSNEKGVTWLDDVRIPFRDSKDVWEETKKRGTAGLVYNAKADHSLIQPSEKGRFPANLLVSDDALNDDFTRYFDLDKWEAQFIITPKPSKSEKNKGLDNFIEQKVNDGRKIDADNAFQRGKTERKNTHPTVKPVSLFKYLVTMGSRENDIVLDPFMGSGTTAIACEQTARDWIGIEKQPEHIEIFKARLANYRKQNKLEVFL